MPKFHICKKCEETFPHGSSRISNHKCEKKKYVQQGTRKAFFCSKCNETFREGQSDKHAEECQEKTLPYKKRKVINLIIYLFVSNLLFKNVLFLVET